MVLKLVANVSASMVSGAELIYVFKKANTLMMSLFIFLRRWRICV